jgi:hypothetical protein
MFAKWFKVGNAVTSLPALERNSCGGRDNAINGGSLLCVLVAAFSAGILCQPLPKDGLWPSDDAGVAASINLEEDWP